MRHPVAADLKPRPRRKVRLLEGLMFTIDLNAFRMRGGWIYALAGFAAFIIACLFPMAWYWKIAVNGGAMALAGICRQILYGRR